MLDLHISQGSQYFDTLNIYCLSQDKNEGSPANEKPSRCQLKGQGTKFQCTVYATNDRPDYPGRKMIDLTATKKKKTNRIIKYLQKGTVHKIKTGQPCVYEMLLTLFWLLKNWLHYPHQSIQDVKGFRKSKVTPNSYAPSTGHHHLLQGSGRTQGKQHCLTDCISLAPSGQASSERKYLAAPLLQQSLIRAYWQVNPWVGNHSLSCEPFHCLQKDLPLFLCGGLILCSEGRKADWDRSEKTFHFLHEGFIHIILCLYRDRGRRSSLRGSFG